MMGHPRTRAVADRIRVWLWARDRSPWQMGMLTSVLGLYLVFHEIANYIVDWLLGQPWRIPMTIVVLAIGTWIEITG